MCQVVGRGGSGDKPASGFSRGVCLPSGHGREAALDMEVWHDEGEQGMTIGWCEGVGGYLGISGKAS